MTEAKQQTEPRAEASRVGDTDERTINKDGQDGQDRNLLSCSSCPSLLIFSFVSHTRSLSLAVPLCCSLSFFVRRAQNI